MSQHHTYIAGEDEGRLASTAQKLGLQRDEARIPKKSWAAILLNDNTLTAARMHSVGTLGQDERVDQYGHLISIPKTRKTPQLPQYEKLADLFTQEEPTSAATSTVVATLDTEEEEEDSVDMVEGGSLNAAAFGIVKGTVGPAILYLPRGFYSSGYAVAIPSMIFATSMFIFNAYRLLECWRVESEKNLRVQNRLKEVQSLLQSKTSEKQYGATTVEQDHIFEPKLLSYPELAKRALGGYAVICELGIVSFQYGVCLTYLIFVPDNLYQCINTMFGTHISKLTFLAVMIAMEVPLSWIRDIRKLTPTNVLASFLIAFGLCSVLGMAFWEGLSTRTNAVTQQEELVFETNLRTMKPLTDTWYLFVGTSFFMMEGSITLIVPLQEAVYRPQDRRKFPDMNRTVTAWICVFYIVFSVICCVAFGSNIKTALTASLTGTLATIVQLAYSIAVILTFPLQAFPAMQVALRILTGGQVNDTKRRNAFATLIVLLLGVVAVSAIDYLGNVVSILGSLFGIPLALVFPPLMHNRLIKDLSPVQRLSNYAVVVVGVFAMGLASFNTIVTWNQGAES